MEISTATPVYLVFLHTRESRQHVSQSQRVPFERLGGLDLRLILGRGGINTTQVFENREIRHPRTTWSVNFGFTVVIAVHKILIQATGFNEDGTNAFPDVSLSANYQ